MAVNEILLNAQNVEGKAAYYNISLPKDSDSPFTVSFLTGKAPHESASDQLFFDQYSGNFIGSNYYKDRNLGSRIRAAFKPVHTGSNIWLAIENNCLYCLPPGCKFPCNRSYYVGQPA
jgi:uncharacterized iron-regulated membrane protein